jgi:hypothetical protein
MWLRRYCITGHSQGRRRPTVYFIRFAHAISKNVHDLFGIQPPTRKVCPNTGNATRSSKLRTEPAKDRRYKQSLSKNLKVYVGATTYSSFVNSHRKEKRAIFSLSSPPEGDHTCYLAFIDSLRLFKILEIIYCLAGSRPSVVTIMLRRCVAHLCSRLAGASVESSWLAHDVNVALASSFTPTQALTSLRAFCPSSSSRQWGDQWRSSGARGFFSTPSRYEQASDAAVEGEHDESLEEIRSRIFGTHVGNGLRSGRKVLRKKLKGETMVAWYPANPIKADPLMPDLKAERWGQPNALLFMFCSVHIAAVCKALVAAE